MAPKIANKPVFAMIVDAPLVPDEVAAGAELEPVTLLLEAAPLAAPPEMLVATEEETTDVEEGI